MPRCEARGVATETGGAAGGGEDVPRAGEKLAAGSIEVVVVLIVAEEDSVDGLKLIRRECRAGGFSQRDGTISPFAAGRIEGGIGEETHAVDLYEGGWAADEPDSHG